MNFHQVLVLAVLALSATTSMVNTTDFWRKQLKADGLPFECYSGTIISIQAMKKSIGTTAKVSLTCTTVFSVPGVTHLLSLIAECLSLSGCRVVPELVLSSEPLLSWVPSTSLRTVSSSTQTPGTSLDILCSSINL